MYVAANLHEFYALKLLSLRIVTFKLYCDYCTYMHTLISTTAVGRSNPISNGYQL